MRTYIGAEVTLDTLRGIPGRNVYSDTSLLVSGASGRGGAVHIILECGYRQGISFLCAHLGLDVVDEVHNVLSSLGNNRIVQALVFAVLPALRNLNLYDSLRACVDGCPVLLNHILALASVGSLCGSLHQLVRLLSGDDSRQGEECGLKDGVDTSRSHTGLNTDLHAVDGVEVDIVIRDVLLHLARQVLIQFFMRPCTVQKEGSSVNQLLHHVVLAYISRIVACNEVCLTDQVCGFNLLMSETQVGHGHTAGLLGIIIKVCLCIHVGIVADDIDGVLVRSNRTVSAKSPELAVRGSFGSGYQFLSQLQGQIGNVVFDTDG